MKKLKLMLNADEIISREEMKKISGGYDDGACIQFICGSTCPTATGWCSCVDFGGGGVGGPICLGG